MSEVDRVSTGISGLDHLFGGYPMGKSIIVCGQSGTGKTILALHFVNGRCSQGERTGYIAVEETREDLLDQAAQFGWDLKSYEDRGLFRVYPILEERRVETKYQYDSYSAERGFGGLIDLVDPGTENVVIDNLGILALDMTLSHFRQQLDYLVFSLSKRKCTSLFICDEATMSKFGEVALYSVDGAVKLMKRDNPYTDSRERVLEVIKMRRTPTPVDYVTFDIGKDGIEIVP
ncbi:MAG: ATPase domain-containing protein [Methanomassiliicoccales archaeon]